MATIVAERTSDSTAPSQRAGKKEEERLPAKTAVLLCSPLPGHFPRGGNVPGGRNDERRLFSQARREGERRVPSV